MRFSAAFLFPPILCALLAVCPAGPGDALAASPPSSRTQTAPLSRPSALQRLISDFSALCKDQTRGGRRDAWLALEGKFAGLAGKKDKDASARAALYKARTRQELARRSFLGTDQREAVRLFAAVAAGYPTHPAAPESLYRQAEILVHRLNENAEATTVLEALLSKYPNAEQAVSAKQLLALAKKRADETAPSAGSTAEERGKKSSITLKRISWKGKPQRAVISLELDAEAAYACQFDPPDAAKKIPGRLYLDITGVLPSGKIAQSGLSPKNLVVSRIRTSRAGAGTRVTLECDGLQCYMVSSPKNAPHTIQIEVSRNDDIKGGVSVSARKNATGSRSDPSVLEQLGLTVQTIMLDAGHGGKDPGAMAGGIIEKHFTLDMTKRVGALLREKGFTVLYTRTGNSYISLQDRPDLANEKKADLFISIHINANSNPDIHGLETYYLDEAKTQDAALVAARENSISVKNISDLQFILTDLMLSSKVKESHQLADCVHKGILQALKKAKQPAPNNGVRSAPFYVLVGARMPAILVEFGYITNSGDAANLQSETYLRRQAEGLVEGILRYKAELAKNMSRLENSSPHSAGSAGLDRKS